MSSENWYCLRTRPSKESQVSGYLRGILGLETYFPRLRRQRTSRRAKRLVTGPLFPRYLFCRFDSGRHFRAVRYAPDVVGVVSFGDHPAVVSDDLIEGMKSWAGEVIDVITLQPTFRPGDRVTITDGPMRGLQAVISQERSDHERVAVLLKILESEAQMIISRRQIARID